MANASTTTATRAGIKGIFMSQSLEPKIVHQPRNGVREFPNIGYTAAGFFLEPRDNKTWALYWPTLYLLTRYLFYQRFTSFSSSSGFWWNAGSLLVAQDFGERNLRRN